MAGNPGNLGMALNSKPDLNLDFLDQATDKFFSSSASSSRESLPQAGEMSSEASGIPLSSSPIPNGPAQPDISRPRRQFIRRGASRHGIGLIQGIFCVAEPREQQTHISHLQYIQRVI